MKNVKVKNAKTHVYAYCDIRFTNKGKGYKYTFGNKGKIRMKYRPFYIGAALKENIYRHLTGNKSNKLVKRRLKKMKEQGLDPIILIIKSFDLREEARDLEEKLIIAIGRKDLGTGPLANKCDGICGSNIVMAFKTRRKLGIRTRGEKHYLSTTTEVKVLRMRKDFKNGMTIIDIAKKYGINYNTLQAILHRVTWKHI